MLVTYSPAGADKLIWTYVAAKVRQSRAEAIETHFGATYEDFNKAILSGSAKARKVLLWHCLTNDHPSIKFRDTPDFAMDEVVVEFDADELDRLKDSVRQSSATEDQKASALAKIDVMISELPVPKA